MHGEIWDAIYQLFHLITEDRKVPEEEVQRYFEENPVVFSVLGFDDAAPFEKSSPYKLPFDEENNTQREPDFICISRDRKIATVLELKTPDVTQFTTSRSDGQREKLRAVLENYISQTTEYMDFISSSVEARRVLCKVFNVDSILQTKGVLLCGVSNNEELAKSARIISKRQHGLDILYFDEVLSRLIESYSTGRPDILVPDEKGDCCKLSGITFCHHFILPKKQVNRKAYIVEIGDTENNRLSIFVENDLIVVEVIDDNGRSHFSESDPAVGEPIFMRVEISDEPGARFLSVFLNNREVEFRVSAQGAKFRPNLKAMTLGADRAGNNCARFNSMTTYYVDRTMNLLERIGSFDYFLRMTRDSSGSSGCLEFDGSQFMIRDQSGSLIQPQNDRRPIYREDFSFVTF